MLTGQVKDSRQEKVFERFSILGVEEALKAYFVMESGIMTQIQKHNLNKSLNHTISGSNVGRYSIPYDCPTQSIKIMSLSSADFFKELTPPQISQLCKQYNFDV